MRIILMRHGITEGNLHRRYNGRTDEPLCEEGILHAQAAGVLSNMAHVYVSPMKRAIQTARICFPNAQMHIIEDLREMDFGDFEGRTVDELACDAAYLEWVKGNCEGECPNGESIASFQKRVLAAFDIVIRDAIERQLKELAIVAHGGSIMAIMSKFAEPASNYYDWYVPNCCGYEIIVDQKTWEVIPRFSGHKYFERLR
ncbi:MAG: histidine phosphatase family protein [Clostridiaceae bacterium]|nr:histidine phosphatase family protein [Clostridiaceae bacterium]